MTKSFDLVKSAIEQNGDALFHCFVPVERHISKKNSRPLMRNRRNGRPFVGKSLDLKLAENHLINTFRLEMLRRPGFQTITIPTWAVFLFHFPRSVYFTKQGQMSQRIPDLSNLYELPQDCLQSAGVISNDHLICAHDLSRRLPSEYWGLEVFLFEYRPEPPASLKIVNL